MNQITSIANSIFSAILTLGPTLPLVPFIPPVIYHVLQSEFKRELLAIKDTVTWDQEYDYIVIGSGSGGSVMAARLSEDPTKTVLLLEAGWAENFLSVIPVVAFFLQKTPMDWNFKTLPQTRSCFGLNNRESVWPRGKAFGGCTAINVMLYVRGNPRDFDQWAADGAYGWSWAEIFPYFIKSEDNRDPEYVATGYHGVGGPLTVSTATDPTKIAQAFRDAGPDLGYPIGDLNGPIQSTFAIPQRTIRDGERCSIARAYLQPLVGRKNLHILGKSFVTKILFNDQKRAIGVEFDRTFVRHVVYARNEIILSAGSINSPKILMLSGICQSIEI
jgi:glucose dehydrogenase (acceptor)